MMESLRRWAWAWVCLAAAGQGQDLSLQPSVHPLPADLAVMPLASDWHLNLTLQDRGAPPAACVRLRHYPDKDKVQLMLLKGDCVHGVTKDYNYWFNDPMPLGATTTLAVAVKDSDVFVMAPNHTIQLMADRWSLPGDYLQVVMVQDVQAEAVSHVNCPLYKHSFEGPTDKKNKVMEWYNNRLHFHYRPWTTFHEVYIVVVCRTGQGEEVREMFTIYAEREGVAGQWRLVEVEQHGSNVTWQHNSGKVQEVHLPDSCTFTRYDIWVEGYASFGFDCKHEHEGEEERRPVTVALPDLLMHPALLAGIGITALVLLLIINIYHLSRRYIEQRSNWDTSGLESKIMMPQEVNEYEHSRETIPIRGEYRGIVMATDSIDKADVEEDKIGKRLTRRKPLTRMDDDTDEEGL